MRVVDQHNIGEYLRETGRVSPRARLAARELTGGVSNQVLLVERLDPPDEPLVIKQARERLRTQQAWFASLERAWREAEVLAACGRLIDAAGDLGPAPCGLRVQTPRILFEDRPNYLFAMSAAPRPHATWKQLLLAGQADPSLATACGELLGTLHAGSWRDATLAATLGDCTLFDELRVDPYYRALSRSHPDAAPRLQQLIESLGANRLALVHADFSPKNLLVGPGAVTMVDFETGHFGDPAFDVGFFLSHLVLKAFRAAPRQEEYLALTEAFRQAYNAKLAARLSAGEQNGLWNRSVQHFAACAWARLDGKSPVEYLSEQRLREQVREVCRKVLAGGVHSWPEVVALCRLSVAPKGP